MHAATLQVGRLPITVAFVLSLLRVSSAYADQITLMWDPNSDQVTGYAVYVGSSRVDVGNATSYTLANATAGQQYCFAVAAYNATGEGPKSSQLCGYSNRFPTLTNPGNRSATVGQATSLQLTGSDPEGQPLTYIATGLPPGLFIGSATGFISGTPSTAGTYTVTASVYDGVLTSPSQNFTWTVAAAPTADTTAPTVSIATPTSASSYATTTTSIALGGAASDSVGVISVNWANDRGGSGAATGTTNWSVPVIGLQVGSNVITVTARDAAGNVGTDILTVTYSAPDTTAPVVTITGPTTGGTYSTTSSTVTVSGTGSDNVGVTAVTWSTDRGSSGTASGTTNWTASPVALQSGANVVTVTARDAAGNLGRATLTVTYTAPDTSAPTISILGPTSASSYNTTSSVVTLGGTSSDNMGVTAVTWVNNRGGNGFSSGTTNWSVPSVQLQGGSNVITMTAQDAAGNKGTAVLTVNYTVPDSTLPVVTITGPTSADTYATNASSFSIGGTASDDVGVTQVTWQNSLGGSGTATGTTTWSAAMTLQLGTNVITVTARDAAGNASTDVLSVTYSAPTAPASTSISLSGRLYSSGRWMKAYLQWSSAPGRYIDIYLNGSKVDRVSNDGSTTENPRGSGPYDYRVCISGTSTCSNTITLTR
jgi:putative Ig domain-containing protein/fibronectin type III domain protein/glucodextranase-like protein/Big-like domain-containing protein